MKTILKAAGFLGTIILFFSCSSLKQISFYDDTDSYVNIKEEKRKKMEMLAQQKKQAEERQKQIQDSIAKEQEKINNNPYYKEPNYNKDDYYDYEYAARIKRFYNPVNGLGYYDNWYTNYGFYGAPNYGSSIYMGYGNYSPYMGYGYNWGNPYYSYGLGTCWGSPYYSPFYGNYWGYSPWMSPYGNFGYTPYYGYGNYWGYSPYYGMGYYPYYGYGYNPYYYNSQDINSMTYAPRTSHEGFNSPRTTNNINGGDNFSKKPVAVSPEMNIPKFDETARPKPVTKFEPSQINAVNAPLIHQINTNPNVSTNIIPRNISNGNLGTGINNNTGVSANPVSPKGTNVNTGRPNFGDNKPTPVPVGTPKESNPNINQNNSMQKGWGGGNSGGGGSFSSPRGGSSGGSVGRPR